MSKVSRFGVSLEDDLLRSFDRSIADLGYANRSEANDASFQLGFQYQPFSLLTVDAAVGRSLFRSGTRVQGTLGLTCSIG
jgi:hypothetical protein